MSEPKDIIDYWHDLLAAYAKPSLPKGIYQLSITGVLFAALWVLMVLSLEYSYLWTLALAFPAAGLLVRLFIIQHDCGHQSFFSSRKANNFVGFCIGVLTLTPYRHWLGHHAIHHADSGKLYGRPLGDIIPLTVDKYYALSAGEKRRYRWYRKWWVILGVGPIYQFFFKHRFATGLAPGKGRRERRSVRLTNLGIVIVIIVMWLTVGLEAFLLIQLPISILAGIAGIWLFFVQHNFVDTFWRDRPDWSFVKAGLKGSSFYDLPLFLHWITGYIGYHHIHHLWVKVPMYNLRAAMKAIPELGQVTRLGLLQSIGCLRLKLYDEKQGRLVSFAKARLARAF